MRVPTPPTAASSIDLAEWLELLALTRPNGTSSEADLQGLLGGAEDDLAAYEGNEEEKDEELETTVQEVFDELDARAAWGGRGYPFEILKENNVLRLRHGIPRFKCLAYLLSLLISFLKRFKEKDVKDVFPAYNQLEDLFQICGTIAAAGYIDGSSVSFGFPRLDSSPFYQKLLSVSTSMGEGRPKTGWSPGASPKPKDAGVDVIAWRECPDRLPGQMYLLGQCATGNTWQTEKTPGVDYKDFHEYYWTNWPHSPLLSATLVPFDLRESVTQGGYESIEEAYSWERWTLTKRFGVVLDRFRLAHYYVRGLAHTLQPNVTIEGRRQLRDVRNWVVNAIQYLQKEHLGDAT
jgi:hypothetical protein